MIRANILGMAEGDYLFIGARLTPPDEYAWRAYDEQDDLAKKAYKYFMVVSNIFSLIVRSSFLFLAMHLIHT